ncbi:hypothetical protein ACOKS3_17310 [Pseudomonas sp. HS6-2]|uniref:glycine-rich domain-containing protein n=1 Tax=Pseudomonas sp. HS6-2 TaxID=3410986 RepID=UPI003BEA9867
MATNDFLSFAGGSGANVLTQAAYVALSSTRSNGFTSGTANSQQLNKVWRQSSVIAASVAQAISDLTGQDAVDDGTTATLTAMFKSAIRGAKSIQRFTASGSFTVPVGVTQIWVSGCAAGGGGGSSLATNSSSFCTGGSGGGAGQSVRRTPLTVSPGQVIAVTIGLGGSGGTPATNNAADGGNTQLGSAGALLNLLGGSKGLVGSGGTAVPANYGGPQGGNGYPNGGYASDTTCYSGGVASGGFGGLGGVSQFGAPGAPGRGASGSSPSAFAGFGFGAGGSGAGGAYNSSVTASGGSGAKGLDGYLEIEW